MHLPTHGNISTPGNHYHTLNILGPMCPTMRVSCRSCYSFDGRHLQKPRSRNYYDLYCAVCCGFFGGLVGKSTQWCRPTTFLYKKWAYCLSAFLSLPTTTAMPSVGQIIGGSVSLGQSVTAVAAILASLSAGSFTGFHAHW